MLLFCSTVRDTVKHIFTPGQNLFLLVTLYSLYQRVNGVLYGCCDHCLDVARLRFLLLLLLLLLLFLNKIKLSF